jgi:hypothetical protein
LCDIYLGIEPELFRELKEDLGVRFLVVIPVNDHNNRSAIFNTIVVPWIASDFHAGKVGSKRTSSFCNTPRLNVQIAYSALSVLPLVSTTETPSSEYVIVVTVVLRRICEGLRNSAASA